MGKVLSIVVTNNHIRIAELTNQSGGIVVSRLLSQGVPKGLVIDGTIQDARAFARFLTSTLKYANIKTKRLVCSLYSDRIMTREIILPEMDEKKLKASLKLNASEYFPIDLTDFVLGYFPVSRMLEDKEGNQAEEAGRQRYGKRQWKARLRLMTAAAPNEMVQSYFDMAKIARLKLLSVDYLGNSAHQLTSGQIGEAASLVLLLAGEHTVLSIYRNKRVVLQRYMDFRIFTLNHESFNHGGEEAGALYCLISNMKRAIEYYTGRNSQTPLEQVCLIGNGSCLPELKLLLENQLGLPVELITALKNVSAKRNTGLSTDEILKYMDNIGAVIAPMNLLPRQMEQDISRKQEARVCRVMILLALLFSLIIVTAPAIRYFNEAMDVMELKNKLLVTEDVTPLLAEYRLAGSRYQDVQEIQSRTRTNNESLLRFIRIFEQLRPENIELQRLQCNEGEVKLSALAQGKRTVAKLILRLNKIASVSDVKVSALSSVFEEQSEMVSFTLTFRLINEDALPAGGKGAAEDEARDDTDQLTNQLDEIYSQLDREPSLESGENETFDSANETIGKEKTESGVAIE